jgi:U3 small nucleolar RNA-associated protein 10
LTYLPYHGTPQFLALLSVLPSQPPPSLRFLHPYIQSPTNPPRRTVVYTAVNTPAFFDTLQSYTIKVVQAGHHSTQMISFWSSITLEAVFGILESSSTGRREIQAQKTEELVLRILPVLNSCMRAKFGAEVVSACYTIVTVLVGRGEVGDKVLDGLLEAVVLAQDPESLHACLQCLAVIAEQRSSAQLPDRVARKLVAIPQIAEMLTLASKQCRAQRLALGCALGALANIGRSDEQRTIFEEIMATGILTESHTRAAISALISSIRDSAPGSEEHGRLLELAAQLAQTTYLLDAMRGAAKVSNVDLESLGLTIGPSLDSAQIDSFDSDDEDMLDIDDEASHAVLPVEMPEITTQTFLDAAAFAHFGEVADAFEQAVAVKQTRQFLASKPLRQTEALQKSLYLSFLARMWCSSRAPLARIAAIRAATTTAKVAEQPHTLQNLIPYLIQALSDPSPPVRRAAAACIVTLSEKSSTKAAPAWGSSDMYGKVSKGSSKIVELKADELSALLTSILVPILEESVMDSSFAIPAIRDLLEGSKHSKSHSKQGLNAQTRTSILSFLAIHTSLTPLIRTRRSLLPIFIFVGKASDAVRSNTVLPLIRSWCTLSTAETIKICEAEDITQQDAHRGHLDALIAKEAKSVQLLNDLVSENANNASEMVDAIFDQMTAFWPAMKAEPRRLLAHTLLNVSFKEASKGINEFSRERAIDLLRNAKHDSTTLVEFLDSVPAAIQMPEGPPTKKRRRASRSEMARVEPSSQDDVQRLLKKLTFVLELIEGSSPGQHPALFRSLFNVFAELQPLKQQSGSELVYLQSMVLGSLTPIVDTLKVSPVYFILAAFANSAQQQSDTLEYQSVVRADLLIDCIRHSASPQVQNSALLLIANLASWVPELILHNLMPIFTFIGSTLLRQQDEYSAQVVDKVCSSLWWNVIVLTLFRQSRAWYRN